MTCTANNFALRRRRGFTLLELMVVIGILLLLAGILLPIVNKARRSAQIAGMKLNFNTLITGLEAYRQDFGAYPKNPFPLIDPVVNTSSSPLPPGLPDAYRPCVPRSDPTLAMALLGPGPANAIVSTAGTSYPNGDVDGADGPGFRTRMAVLNTVSFTSASGTSVLLQTSLPAADSAPPPAGSQLQFSAVGIGPPGSPDAVIPIKAASGSTITLLRPLYQTYNSGTCTLLIPAGKAFDGYVKSDQFKVSYVQVPTAEQPTVYTSQYETLPLPVLQDNWGGPILYFPAYNSYTGRLPSTTTYPTNTLTFPNSTAILPTGIASVTAPLQAGPIFGSPSLTAFSQNSPLDSGKDTVSSIFWSGPLWNLTLGQVQAILVKLGDLNANNAIDTPVNPVTNAPMPETLNVQAPFFLMSAGPDGIFTDLTNANPGDWVRIVSKADDVYSFEP